MGNKNGAGILERLSAGDVVVVAMTVDNVPDRRLGDLAYLGYVSRRRRPPLPDRIGGDHAFRCDDEHGLVALITENVDAVGALDLGSREQRWGRGLRAGRQGCSGQDTR